MTLTQQSWEPAGDNTPRGRVAVWTLVDQGASSLTNLAAVVLAARASSSTDFGGFAVMYGVMVITIGAVQSMVSQPLVLDQGTWVDKRGHANRAIVVAFVVGSGCSVGCAMAAIALPGLRGELVVMAACTPFVVVQDTGRFCCSLLRRMDLAALGDTTWLALTVGVGLVVANDAARSGWTALLVWAGPGAVVGVVSWFVLRRAFAFSPTVNLSQYARPTFLGYRFLAEFAAVRGSNQVMAISLGALISLSVAGAVRGVQTLFGPLNVLVQSVSSFGAPLLMDRGPRARTLALAVMGAALMLVGVAMMIALLIIPSEVGRALLGDTWAESSSLILPLGLQAAFVGPLSTAMLGVRIVRPKATLPIQLISTVFFVGLFCSGVALNGGVGAAWAFGIGTMLQFVYCCIGYALALRWAAKRAVS